MGELFSSPSPLPPSPSLFHCHLCSFLGDPGDLLTKQVHTNAPEFASSQQQTQMV